MGTHCMPVEFGILRSPYIWWAWLTMANRWPTSGAKSTIFGPRPLEACLQKVASFVVCVVFKEKSERA